MVNGSFQVELQFKNIGFVDAVSFVFFLEWYLDRFNCCYSDKLCQSKKDTGFPERQTNKMCKIMKINHTTLRWITSSSTYEFPQFIFARRLSLFLTSDKYPTLTLQVLYLFNLHCFAEIV